MVMMMIMMKDSLTGSQPPMDSLFLAGKSSGAHY
jgi:hypothetical protein